MIELHGPTYKYSGEILSQPEIIFVNDHHYDEESRCFHLQTLMENSVCDTSEHLIVFNNEGHEDQLSQYPNISLSIYLADETKKFIQHQLPLNWKNKQHTFNFSINKPRLHREFLMVLVNYFKLTNYNYSLCWPNGYRNTNYLEQIVADKYIELIKSTLVNYNGKSWAFGPEIYLGQGLRNGNFSNALTYRDLLRTNIFEKSCISLITEPCFYEKDTFKTEKTLMAIYAGTLPIWIGGWRIPDSMKLLGFDVFDDIIDHSYQCMPDPWDRCYYAIEKNLGILNDFNAANTFISNNINRLLHNVNLLEQNIFEKDVQSKINNFNGQQKPLLRVLAENYNFRKRKDYVCFGSI